LDDACEFNTPKGSRDFDDERSGVPSYVSARGLEGLRGISKGSDRGLDEERRRWGGGVVGEVSK